MRYSSRAFRAFTERLGTGSTGGAEDCLDGNPTLRSSMPGMGSPRLTGSWSARLAARRSIHRSARAGKPTGAERGDGGFLVDSGRLGATVNEAGEVVAFPDRYPRSSSSRARAGQDVVIVDRNHARHPPAICGRVGRSGNSDSASDYGRSLRQTQRNDPRLSQRPDLHKADPARPPQTKTPCMACRRSTRPEAVSASLPIIFADQDSQPDG